MSSSSNPTALSEQFELAQYEKITEFHDRIMSGRHSQFKAPNPPTYHVERTLMQQVSAARCAGGGDSQTSKLPQIGTKRFNIVSTFEIEIDGNCDYYEILGVNSNASVDEITKAYEALKNTRNTSTGLGGHAPKLLGSGPEFEKKIKEAHYILSICQLRQQYDEMKGKTLSKPILDLAVQNGSTGQSQHRIPMHIPENAAAHVNGVSLGFNPASHNDRPTSSRECSSSAPPPANGPGRKASHQDKENREASQLQERPRGTRERSPLERRGSETNYARDYYKVLGVDDSWRTTQESIYRSYRHKYKEYCPRSRHAEPKWKSSNIGVRREVERRWEELQDAYYTLGDAARRQRYDMDRDRRRKPIPVAPRAMSEHNQGVKMEAAKFNSPAETFGRLSCKNSSTPGGARQPPTPTVLTPASTPHSGYPADALSPPLGQKPPPPPPSAPQAAALKSAFTTSSSTPSRTHLSRRLSRLNSRRRRVARRRGRSDLWPCHQL